MRNYLVKLVDGESTAVCADGYVFGHDRDFVFWIGSTDARVPMVGFKGVSHIMDLGKATQIC